MYLPDRYSSGFGLPYELIGICPYCTSEVGWDYSNEDPIMFVSSPMSGGIACEEVKNLLKIKSKKTKSGEIKNAKG